MAWMDSARPAFRVRCSDSTQDWQIRELVEKDLDQVCVLCRAAFPLDYPLDWYKEVVTGRYISFGLFNDGLLTSLLVAERKKVHECDVEDRTLSKDPNATVIYILSLAVSETYRRKGLATVLLDYLMLTFSNVPPLPTLVFLHVLSDNFPAISFYRKNGFRHHATLSNYYLIDGQYRSGCTFVRYTSTISFGDLFYSIFDFCGSFFDFLTLPFRRCFRLRQNRHLGERYPRHERLVSI